MPVSTGCVDFRKQGKVLPPCLALELASGEYETELLLSSSLSLSFLLGQLVVVDLEEGEPDQTGGDQHQVDPDSVHDVQSAEVCTEAHGHQSGDGDPGGNDDTGHPQDHDSYKDHFEKLPEGDAGCGGLQ